MKKIRVMWDSLDLESLTKDFILALSAQLIFALCLVILYKLLTLK